MADLTPAEQQFFATGQLQPGMVVDETPPVVDPLALAGVGNAPAPSTVVPVAAPSVDPTQPAQPDVAELLRRSLAEAHQRVAQLEQHIQQVQQPKVPEVVAPDPTTDPLGAMMHQLKTVNEQVASLQQKLEAQQGQQANASQFQQFQTSVRALRDEFVKTTADFPDAYAHIRNTRISDLRAFGYNDTQIQQALFQEEAQLAAGAIQNGRNPAEVVYEMAKRHGYQPKTAAAAPASPDAKLAAIQAAQNAARNLPRTPQPPEDLTTEGLKAASDADLNKLVLDPKMWAKIVGSDQYPL